MQERVNIRGRDSETWRPLTLISFGEFRTGGGSVLAAFSDQLGEHARVRGEDV